MKKSDVKIGETYSMRHTSGLIRVRILGEVTRYGYGNNARDRFHWRAINLNSGREIEVKSAIKLSPIRPVAV